MDILCFIILDEDRNVDDVMQERQMKRMQIRLESEDTITKY